MPLFRKKGHHAAVYLTRPIPGDKNQFEPYFVAMCECDWVGDVRESSEEEIGRASCRERVSIDV